VRRRPLGGAESLEGAPGRTITPIVDYDDNDYDYGSITIMTS